LKSSFQRYETRPFKAAAAALSTAIEDGVVEGSSAPVSAFQDILGRFRTGVDDVNIIVVIDSTAAMAGSWVDELPSLLVEEFPAYQVNYRKWTAQAFTALP
jgi:hypothetical protein